MPQVFLIYEGNRFTFFIQGVLSLTFGEDAAKPSKDKDAMYSARPEIEVLLLLLRPAPSQLTPGFSRTLTVF